MKFVLVFRGDLPASQKRGKPETVKRIREQFHPQLKKLWEVSPTLRALSVSARVFSKEENAKGNYKLSGLSPFDFEPISDALPPEDREIDLTGPIEVQNKFFRPLVRRSLNTYCKLRIQFLRTDEPGNLFNGAGDIDNRIKTLCDALEMPANDSDPMQFSDFDCTYCLCENDKLITGFNIETERLLLPDTQSQKEVHLVIEVEIGVSQVGLWNLPLMSSSA